VSEWKHQLWNEQLAINGTRMLPGADLEELPYLSVERHIHCTVNLTVQG
jgi:hypothetical protein